MGYFSNMPGLIMDRTRKETTKYFPNSSFLAEDEKKLFAMLKKADAEGMLVDEKALQGF